MENGNGDDSMMEWEQSDGFSTSNSPNKNHPNPKKKKKPRDLLRQSLDTQIEPEEEGAVRIGNIRYWDNKKAGTGKGGTGSVYQGKFIINKKKSLDAAVKKIDPGYVKVFDNEIHILMCLNHQNIVKYYGSVPSGDYHYIAMELCDIDMEEYVTKYDPSPNFEEIMTYLKQICEALCSMHKSEKEGIVHRDIKPSNILLKFNDKPPHIAKLTDFGLSKSLEQYKHQTQTSTGRKATETFMSPEWLIWAEAEDGKQKPKPFKATKESDIYSLGLTFYYCLTGGKHPCGGIFHRLLNLKEGKIDLSDLQSDEYVPVLHLIESILHKDPKKRPNMEAILSHPAFWTSSKTLQFINDVCNTLNRMQDFLQNQYNKFKITDWVDRLCKPVQNWMKKMAEGRRNSKKYDGKLVIKLVEFIRDKDQHQSDWANELSEPNVFGGSDEVYVKYFTDRFPFLVIFLYLELNILQEQRKMRPYYCQQSTNVWHTAAYYNKLNGNF